MSIRALQIATMAYGAIGWPTLPVHRTQKRPMTANGVYGAEIGNILLHPDSNIAVPTGKPIGAFVVDVDVRSGGWSSIDRLLVEFGQFPETVSAETPSGGRHWFFKMPTLKPGQKIVGKLAQGIDILGTGRYAVISPSHNSQGVYRWVRDPWRVPLSPAPQWLVNRIIVDDVGPVNPPGPTDNHVARASALEWLAEQQPAISGHGGHGLTFSIAQVLTRYFGLSEADALECIQDWNQRCVPPWSARELRHKITQAARYGHFKPSHRFGEQPYTRCGGMIHV